MPPLPPPPPPPTFPLPKAGPILTTTAADDYSSYPSLAIIAAIICFAILAASFIHFLLRCRRRRIHHLYSSSSLSSSSSSSSIPRSPNPPPSDLDPKVVIDSLPLFSLASSNLKPSASLDCAVCLSPFRPSDELRLLPSCCHAFHSQCIDTWLNSNLSCPLCRSPVLPAPPTAPSTPPLESLTSESFRLEIGSVSHRTTDHPSASHVRSYSLGSSFNYVVDDDIDEVLASVRRVPAMEKFEAETPPAQPGAEVAAAVGGESQRSWLREYVDRLASSASSSFSSLRLSQRWSRRFDSAAVGGDSWDLERNLHLHLEEDDGGFAAFYRWLVGA